ncbi:MAG: hypothetical protein ABI723_22835 [Bacteroidia bacterium]
MTVEYLTKGKKKGVFLSVEDWDSIQKELNLLKDEISEIEKRRKEILKNFNKSKKEKLKFSSDLNQLKTALK